jgi:lipoprotein-releasing system permease protein
MSITRSIAFRFLKANKAQTLFIVLGISIGISIQVFIGVLITSLQNSIVDSVVGDSSHITVISDKVNDTQIEDYDKIIDKIEKFDEISAISVAQDSPALTEEAGKRTSLFVRGFDIDDADKIYEISDKIIEGKIPKSTNEVIIGKELSEDLKLEVDDKFIVQANATIYQEVTISGIYDFNVVQINELWIITTLKTAQSIFANGDDTVTSIETQVYEEYLFEADVIGKSIEEEIDNKDITVQNWIEQNDDLQGALRSQGLSSYLIQAFAIISVVIGIASVLSITVLQKNRQLGILKAMGINNRDASKIFLYQGLFFGIAGAIGGIALGLFLLYGFTIGTGPGLITIEVDPFFIILSAIIVISASVIASLSPAVKSSKLDPIDIIRGE